MGKIITDNSAKAYKLIVIFIVSFLFFIMSIHLDRAHEAFSYKGNLNIDSPTWFSAAKNLPESIVTSIWQTRPLYPFLVGTIRWLIPSSDNEEKDIYRASLSINFVCFFLINLLIYKDLSVLVRGNFYIKILTVIWFCGNHIVLTWLNQPLPQILDYLMVLIVVNGSLKLYQSPSSFNLKNWSWAQGVFLLAKPYFFNIIFSVFIILRHFKNYRYVLSYIMRVSSFYLIWILAIIFVFNAKIYDHSYHSNFEQGRWLLKEISSANFKAITDMLWPSISALLSSVYLSLKNPLNLFILGGLILSIKEKNIIVQSLMVFFGTVFLLCYAMRGLFFPRLGFYLFPYAILGWFYSIQFVFSYFSKKYIKYGAPMILLSLYLMYSFYFFPKIVFS